MESSVVFNAFFYRHILFVYISMLVTPSEVVYSVTVPWSHELQARKDLVCDTQELIVQTGAQQTHFSDKCTCCCDGYGTWERDSNLTLQLYVRYDIRNNSGLIFAKSTNRTHPFYILRHQMGTLGSLPVNIDQYADRLVLVDLGFNAISTLDRLKHVHKLDTLNLTGNRVTRVENSSFFGLTNLRILDLSSNLITSVAPGLLDQLRSLVQIDLADNFISVIDGTNIVLQHPFCTLSYKGNAISHVTNELNKTIDMLTSYGPGTVLLQDNAFSAFFDLDELGVKDLSLIGRLMSLDIQITDIKWTCDCHMIPFLNFAKFTIMGGWMGSDDIRCYDPVNLRGQSIIALVKSNSLDLFNCSINEEHGCPPGCLCIDQPSNDKLIVNCTSVGLYGNLPDILPQSVSKNIELLMANNYITNLETRPYLDKVSLLDLSNNSLNKITDGALKALVSITELSLQNNPNIRQLPAAIKTMDPSRIILGNITIDCDCSSDWIYSWVHIKSANNSSQTNITCNTEKGQILAKDFNTDYLDCTPVDQKSLWMGLILSSAALLFLIVGAITYMFRYELFLLLRNFRSLTKTYIHPIYKYDVYVAVDETSTLIMPWVRNDLLPVLETSGYSVFLPARQLSVGEAQQDAVLNAMRQCKSFLLILSTRSDYNVEEDSCKRLDEIEMIYFWNMFKKDMCRKIAVVNFDKLSASDINRKQYRAILRLGLDIDITDRKRKFYNILMSKLGPPQEQPEADSKPDDGVFNESFQSNRNETMVV